MAFSTAYRALLLGCTFAACACGLPGYLPLGADGSAFAQELTENELLPGRRQLAPTEKDVTVDNLKFGAEVAIARWKVLQEDPTQQGFDAYFEIFREVARIESLERASQLAGVGLQSELAAAAAQIHADLLANDLTADAAGKAALAVLVESDGALFAEDRIERLKVSYALILDYLGDIEAARLAIELAARFAEDGLVDLAAETYADFVPYYFGLLETAAERRELVGEAAQKASLLNAPEVMRALGEVLTNAPVSEKVELSRLAFTKLDPAYLVGQLETAEGARRTTLQAWIHGVQMVSGAPPTDLAGDLFERASATANFVAFELVYAAQQDRTARKKLLEQSLGEDIGAGRPLLAFQKLNNLPLGPEDVLPVYLALIESFADHGYGTYVALLADEVAAAVSAGSISLDDVHMSSLFAALETVPDNARIDRLVEALPGTAALGERAKLRGSIRRIFAGPVDRPVGAAPIAVPSGSSGALSAAADLIGGKLVPGDAGSAPAEDLDLLAKVAERLWHYRAHRKVLADFVASETDPVLRQVVALGVTANPAFDVTGPKGAAVAAGIEALLPSLAPSHIKDLLGASIGDVDEEAIPRGQTLVRYARYLASKGEKLDVGVAETETEKRGLLEARAVFNGASEMTGMLKEVPDYLDRVRAFHRLAAARADVLDSKGWLNGAVRTEAAGPMVPEFSPNGVASDGRLTLKTSGDSDFSGTRTPFMPNLLTGPEAVTSSVPVPEHRNLLGALASIAKRGETRATRLVRFSSEHYDGLINLGAREYVFLNTGSSTPRIIFISQGVLTASELVSQIQASDPDAITFEDGIVTLNVPLAINEGAELILSGLEIKEFRLNTNKGAFLVNSGRLFVDRVTVSSFDEETGKPSFVTDGGKKPMFRPFLLSWSNSRTFASSSHFVALGYAGGRTYGLSLSAGPSDAVSKRLHSEPPTGTFINNSFDNLYYGFYTYEAEDVVYVGNELVNGVIYGLDPHDWSYNLMMAYNAAYGTQKKHGIIISREVDDSYIVGNLSFENKGSGIMLDRMSFGTIVFANDASHNKGDGFAAMESPCVLVDSNYFAGNRRAGVKIRNSWDVHVANNIVAGNRAAGVEAYIDNLRAADASEFRNFKKDPFLPVATLSAVRNQISDNAVGVAIRGATEGMYFQNRFIDQAPKYASGDIKPLAIDVVSRSMSNGVQVRSACVPKITIEKSCSLFQKGIIYSHVAQAPYRGADAAENFCVDVAGTPQANSFNSAGVE
ncbi:right-handed parallel beta-helix repeat-containing protein [Roseibium sp. Sym1]|uniref:right-handed parallel beta-helix repeat-containing protein n=1 Tax=Roseibium sp. Sym1 TaxID=3016006 RepID=UPI0022B306FE|nr:right-handed parallel beta-helix repeat-containing protein [Roseibium sp. Sym1]